MLRESGIQFTQRTQKPGERIAVRTNAEAAEDAQTPRRFTELPGQVPHTAEHFIIQPFGFRDSAGLLSVVNRLFHQVQRGRILRQT